MTTSAIVILASVLLAQPVEQAPLPATPTSSGIVRVYPPTADKQHEIQGEVCGPRGCTHMVSRIPQEPTPYGKAVNGLVAGVRAGFDPDGTPALVPGSWIELQPPRTGPGGTAKYLPVGGYVCTIDGCKPYQAVVAVTSVDAFRKRIMKKLEQDYVAAKTIAVTPPPPK